MNHFLWDFLLWGYLKALFARALRITSNKLPTEASGPSIKQHLHCFIHQHNGIRDVLTTHIFPTLLPTFGQKQICIWRKLTYKETQINAELNSHSELATISIIKFQDITLHWVVAQRWHPPGQCHTVVPGATLLQLQ